MYIYIMHIYIYHIYKICVSISLYTYILYILYMYVHTLVIMFSNNPITAMFILTFLGNASQVNQLHRRFSKNISKPTTKQVLKNEFVRLISMSLSVADRSKCTSAPRPDQFDACRVTFIQAGVVESSHLLLGTGGGSSNESTDPLFSLPSQRSVQAWIGMGNFLLKG